MKESIAPHRQNERKSLQFINYYRAAGNRQDKGDKREIQWEIKS